jgi:hypothetical protein
MTSRLAEIQRTDLGVKDDYRHAPKWATSAEPIRTDGAVLKWYRLFRQDQPVPEEIEQLARNYLARNALEAKGLGFVILHRCGDHFYFLIVNTWRGNNELWETVFYKDGGGMADFALWPRDGMHKPAFCVWELAPVWHETKSWERFLISERNEAAAQGWLADVYSGAA